MKDNNKTNYTNVTLNSTSRGCKAEPYPFSASAVIQSLFKFNKLVNSKTCHGLRHWRLFSNLKNNFSKPVRNDMDNKNRLDCFAFARNDEIVGFEDNKILNQVQNNNVTRHTEGDSPKDLQTQNHVITRKTNRAECGAVCQNDRLSAGHIWQTRSHVYGEVKCQAEIRSDVVIPNELGNGETCKGLLRRFVHKITNNNENSPHNDMNNKNCNKLINLSTCRIIDLKNVTNLFPYFPISLSLKKKIDSSPNALALNGYGFALMLELVRLRMTAFTLAESATHVDLSPTKVKFAFTLAEVLITLGIIGIVAAITIPGLINNYKANKLRTQYLKSYSTLAQMIKLIEQDDIELNDTDTIMNLTKYLPGSTKKEGSALQDRNNIHNDSFYYYLSDNYKTYDGKGNANRRMFDDVQYALPDGSLLLMEWDNIHFPNGDHNWISVDINGYNNGPNRWGVDLFTFQVLDGKMLAIGDEGSIYTDMSQYCNSQRTTNYHNGIACAHLAKTDTEYFKKAVRLK